MEHDDRHLDSFTSSMIQYLNEVLIEKNCVSSTFRKHSVKNEDDVEFTFLLKRRIDSSCDDNKPFEQIDSSCVTEEEVEKLKKISKLWCLHIADVSFKYNRLCINLNKAQTFSVILKSILTQKSNYGKSFDEKQLVKVTSDVLNLSDLTEYRASILKTTGENILRGAGYKLSDAQGDNWIHFTTKHLPKKDDTDSKITLLCGAVVNSLTKIKETQITTHQYRGLILKDLQTMAESKSESNSEHLATSLAEASVRISLLQVKSTQTVSLNFNPECSGQREAGSKGGVFLQYNASRLSAIRKKYEQLVSDGVYPRMPEVDEVDFSVLKESEEWSLLFNFLLEFPSLVGRLAKEMAAGRSEVHLLCSFLTKLSSVFSVYYRRVRILLEPREHLLSVIHARLILCIAVEQILENGMAFFDIMKIEEM